MIQISGTLKASYDFPLPVGSYKVMSNNCYCVDKTLLIRDLIDDHNYVTLFARPQGFGKTLTIDMLKTYFEKTDEDTSVYFENKKIWKCGEKYRKYQGAYPVIALTFTDVKYDSWQESIEVIRLIIKDEYQRHNYILEDQNISADDRDYFERIEKGALSDVELSRALINLIRILSAHYQSEVVVLIDDYDTPIQQGYSCGFYDEINAFMRVFLSGGLKDNHNLAFGVLTGVMPLTKEISSVLDNIYVNTVLDQRYSTYFGFTEKETMSIAAYYGASDKIGEVSSWYGGYNFAGASIYNSRSVTNYFSNGCNPQAFWTNTPENEIIRELITNLAEKVAYDIIQALQGNFILISQDADVINPGKSSDSNTFFNFLFYAGFLTLASEPEETEYGTFLSLKIPNIETKCFLVSLVNSSKNFRSS